MDNRSLLSNELKLESDIRGLDLEIDPHTQKICESYNTSSGGTRGTLYLLIVVSIISLIAVFNSNPFMNWSEDRVQHTREKLYAERNKSHNRDKIRHDLDSAYLENRYRRLQTLDLESNYSVRVAIIGVTIDVNDLAPISGLAFIILMIVLRFALRRERENLKLALNSIHERYVPTADAVSLQKKFRDFSGQSQEFFSLEQWSEKIAEINCVRRRYHYNYLTMNEIFNMPSLDGSGSNESRFEKFVNSNLFYFIVCVYCAIVLNDFCSLYKAVRMNSDHSLVWLILTTTCFLIIYSLAVDCTSLKRSVTKHFESFRRNNYTYYTISQRKRPGHRLIKAFALLVGLWLLSKACSFVSDLPTQATSKEILTTIFGPGK